MDEVISLTLSWEELAKLRFIANAPKASTIFYWIEDDRIDALGAVLDRNGWTTDKVVGRLRDEDMGRRAK